MSEEIKALRVEVGKLQSGIFAAQKAADEYQRRLETAMAENARLRAGLEQVLWASSLEEAMAASENTLQSSSANIPQDFPGGPASSCVPPNVEQR